MALSDILNKYGDTTGIMQQPGIVPYKTVASNYQVYNTDTDTLEDKQTFNYSPMGLMSASKPQTEEPYISGPTSTISYGTTEEGTPRLLTDIKTGETTYAQTGEPYTPPAVDTTPPEDTTPPVDPCPEGYELINGVCQPIKKKEKSDRQETITVEPKSLTNQARDLKGTVNFDKDISATDPNLREGQYEYNPSRKTLNPFETGGIIGTVKNGLHNIGQWMNEQQAMAKGILRDTNGDGKPDTIDTVQVTRNYQEEELGLPPGARAMGASLSMQKDTQYNTLKNIFEESQVLGEQPQPTEPKKEEKLTKEVTPRFKGGFGELLDPKEFTQLERDVDVAFKQIASANETLNQAKDIYSQSMQTAQDYRDYVTETKAAERKLEKARQEIEEKNKKLEEEKKRRQEIVDNYNRLQKQKQQEELEKIQKARKEGKETPRQKYDRGSQKDRERDTGKGGTGFSPSKGGPSVSGERLRGGI